MGGGIYREWYAYDELAISQVWSKKQHIQYGFYICEQTPIFCQKMGFLPSCVGSHL